MGSSLRDGREPGRRVHLSRADQTMSPSGAREWINRLALEPHPEGGFYRETYRAPHPIESPRHPGTRAASTAIYYLLREGDVSTFHRLLSDEVWHHYAGGSLTVHTLSESDGYEALHLGLDLTAGQRPQAVVPGGVWFGATVDEGSPYVVAGCTVAPGFDFADFETARREELVQRFPAQREIIERLTRS